MIVADDVLRQVPTFSLFRRSSSLSTHPTAQGVSLRSGRREPRWSSGAVQRSVRRLVWTRVPLRASTVSK
jgi:hypothetical protein